MRLSNMSIATLSLQIVTEALSSREQRLKTNYKILRQQAKQKGFTSPEEMVDNTNDKIRNVLTGAGAAYGAYRATNKAVEDPFDNPKLNALMAVGLPAAGAALGYGVGSAHKIFNKRMLKKMKATTQKK